jgi:hypothetical protein
VNLACCKPKEFGYAAELWTRSALARHVRQHAVQAGYPALAKAAKATVQRILDAQSLRPHKVRGDVRGSIPWGDTWRMSFEFVALSPLLLHCWHVGVARWLTPTSPARATPRSILRLAKRPNHSVQISSWESIARSICHRL